MSIRGHMETTWKLPSRIASEGLIPTAQRSRLTRLQTNKILDNQELLLRQNARSGSKTSEPQN